MHVVLLVFCINAQYLCYLCSYAPASLPHALAVLSMILWPCRPLLVVSFLVLPTLSLSSPQSPLRSRVEVFDDEGMSSLPKPCRKTQFILSVSNLLARAVPALCSSSAFLTRTAHRTSCLHWEQVYKQQLTRNEFSGARRHIIVMMMMMILHQVRHGRQDNHATNHVRCAATSRSKQSRWHIEAKHSEAIYLSIMCQWNTTPAKQSTEKAPRQCLLGKHNL
jgi:hypothetical protein